MFSLSLQTLVKHQEKHFLSTIYSSVFFYSQVLYSGSCTSLCVSIIMVLLSYFLFLLFLLLCYLFSLFALLSLLTLLPKMHKVENPRVGERKFFMGSMLFNKINKGSPMLSFIVFLIQVFTLLGGSLLYSPFTSCVHLCKLT